jgi:hypothetical protein
MHPAVEVLRLLLEHPSADPAAMLGAAVGRGTTAVMAAAAFAVGLSPARSCAPLLFVLRRVAVESQPSDDQQAHMTNVMGLLCQGPYPRSEEMFGTDQPDDARDECVRLLLERGSSVVRATSPVISRIIREYAQLERVPQLLNELPNSEQVVTAVCYSHQACCLCKYM